MVLFDVTNNRFYCCTFGMCFSQFGGLITADILSWWFRNEYLCLINLVFASLSPGYGSYFRKLTNQLSNFFQCRLQGVPIILIPKSPSHQLLPHYWSSQMKPCCQIHTFYVLFPWRYSRLPAHVAVASRSCPYLSVAGQAPFCIALSPQRVLFQLAGFFPIP